MLHRVPCRFLFFEYTAPSPLFLLGKEWNHSVTEKWIRHKDQWIVVKAVVVVVRQLREDNHNDLLLHAPDHLVPAEQDRRLWRGLPPLPPTTPTWVVESACRRE